jgi:hypothetical protein
MGDRLSLRLHLLALASATMVYLPTAAPVNAETGLFDTLKGWLDQASGKATIVSGNEVCARGSQGPDCQAAADKICRAHGFASSSPFDTLSSKKCSAERWLAHRDSACVDEHVVTRALCR